MTDRDKLLQEAINLWGRWVGGRDIFGKGVSWFIHADEYFGDPEPKHRSWNVLTRHYKELYTPTEASHLIIGWAHDELVRRGWIIKTTECPEVQREMFDRCRLQITADGKPTLAFHGPILLRAYLEAIRATEDKP